MMVQCTCFASELVDEKDFLIIRGISVYIMQIVLEISSNDRGFSFAVADSGRGRGCATPRSSRSFLYVIRDHFF